MINSERFLFTEPMVVHTNVYPKAEGFKELLTNIIRDLGDQQNHETNVKADMTTWDMYKNEYFKLIIDFAIDTLNVAFCCTGGDDYSPENEIENSSYTLYKLEDDNNLEDDDNLP